MTNYSVVKDEVSLHRAIDALEAAQVIGLDLETTGLDPFLAKTRLLTLSTGASTFVVDCAAFSALASARLRALLEAKRPVKVLHHGAFDARFLLEHGIKLAGACDTMLGSQLVAAGADEGGHSLKAVASRLLDREINKDEQLSDWSGELTASQLEYAAADARILLDLRGALVDRLRRLDMLETAALEFSCMPVFAAMEHAGIRFHRERWLELCVEVERETERLCEEVARELSPRAADQLGLFGETAAPINLNSPKQVKEALNRLGVPAVSTKESEIAPYANAHPVIRRLLEYRGKQKLAGTYGRSFLDHLHRTTGRVHASFRQLGARGGRASSDNPNVQNLPADQRYRDCVVAREGRKLIVSDYSQIELRVLADFSGDAAMCGAFARGEDLHQATASTMFKVPLSEVSKKQRSLSKAINFGLMYGMGEHGLAARIDSTPPEARRLMDAYFEAFSGVAAWLEAAARRGVAERMLRTASGRLIVFEFDDSDPRQVAEVERQSKNAMIQGTAADITKKAMVLAAPALAELGADIINTIHDELLVEVDEPAAPEAKLRLKRAMIEAGRHYVKNVPIEVEAVISDVWSKEAPAAA